MKGMRNDHYIDQGKHGGDQLDTQLPTQSTWMRNDYQKSLVLGTDPNSPKKSIEEKEGSPYPIDNYMLRTEHNSHHNLNTGFQKYGAAVTTSNGSATNELLPKVQFRSAST